MSDIASLATALGFWSFMKTYDALKDEQNFKREEEFVPFKLPALSQKQPIPYRQSMRTGDLPVQNPQSKTA